MVVEIDGAPHMIEQIQVQTPSARGAATLYKIKARNLKTKARVEKAYRGTDSLNESSFERRPVQFLYRDAEVIAIEIPDTVAIEIVETAPGVRGTSATGRTKPATLATGAVIQVPEHL